MASINNEIMALGFARNCLVNGGTEKVIAFGFPHGSAKPAVELGRSFDEPDHPVPILVFPQNLP